MCAEAYSEQRMKSFLPLPLGILPTDQAHFYTDDGTCSRCGRVEEDAVPLLLWMPNKNIMLRYCYLCMADCRPGPDWEQEGRVWLRRPALAPDYWLYVCKTRSVLGHDQFVWSVLYFTKQSPPVHLDMGCEASLAVAQQQADFMVDRFLQRVP